MFYYINLHEENKRESDSWLAYVGFRGGERIDVVTRLADVKAYDDQTLDSQWNELWVSRRAGALDASFADTLAATLAHFIEVVTPRTDAILDESNEEGA